MITTNFAQSQNLQEIGMPQNTYFGWYEKWRLRSMVEGEPRLIHHDLVLKIEEDEDCSLQLICSSYSLEELIECLGNEFGYLGKLVTLEGKEVFSAHSKRDEKGNYKGGIGETPLLALTNLAFAVKGKK